ncbi:unnamed protein product [Microthlaspi erraticum]|uniref:DUF4218 domain-containing protein n=1 Tax=Microthlaspi erraticum TaxID=1685480 RepID=A0A6D2HE29_9BRAS|nr:unnamed protein product [Microthlaspi erraticum]CAA7014201.1 unnamed protein product [Microthlaspi erraticum]
MYNGFLPTYTNWHFHSERLNVKEASVLEEPQQDNSLNEDFTTDLLNDVFPNLAPNFDDEAGPSNHAPNAEENVDQAPISDERRVFDELSSDAHEELYEGCTSFSKLSFMLKLYHIKCITKISDKGMSMIIDLLNEAFKHAKFPASLHDLKKTVRKLGLQYESIHACPNDCMLFWGEDSGRETCKICETSRWKMKGNEAENEEVSEKKKKNKKQAAKVLRYFPLKPRLQRLFMSSKTVESMKWHALAENKDGKLRHPRDGQAWKTFDQKFPVFASDARNVRLGLATDGFNPYGAMSTNYSIWPVLLFPYNLPPWMAMKHSSMILSMIIPGKQMPGNDLDVYLQPLIKELKELWATGVQTIDASTKKTFCMLAALMWTISDFPGLGNLSGWNTYTDLACPSCNYDSAQLRLHHGKKNCFMGHRRFLQPDHKFRYDKKHFDGKEELRLPPVTPSGSTIMEQQESVDVVLGKNADGTKKKRDEGTQWRKKSIFFELPYWKHSLLRHNLDVMHIEKNVFDNVVFTLLGEKRRSKDNLNARKDLHYLGIRSELWPDANGKYLPASFKLTNQEKDIFLSILKSARIPDGYSSNISKCIDVKQRKILGLKSHDSHVIMGHLLPIALRSVLSPDVTSVIAELCHFFRDICSKVIDVSELLSLQKRIVLVLCHLEMLFPPSFFTVMVHLIVHLTEEVKFGGPVQFRWMYPVERKFKDELSRANMRGRKRRHPLNIDREVHLHFEKWLRQKVERNEIANDDIRLIANGPSDKVLKFSSYNINGYKYRTLERDGDLKTQNCGVYISAETISYASSRDTNPRAGDVPYYGKLIDIIQLNYYDKFRVILFKCKWADTRDNRGYKRDIFGHHMVNFSRTIHSGAYEEDEPFVLASQAKMVYYVEDPSESGWSIGVHITPRDLYEMGESDVSDDPPENIDINDSIVNDRLLLSDEIPNFRLVRDTMEDDDDDDV